MKRQAFIFSLPRSGSAWLSVFLSGRDSFCFHEPLIERKPLNELFASVDYGVVCAVDTMAYTCADQVRRELPDAAFFVLRRDIRAIERSSRALELPPIDYEHHERQLLEATRGLTPIHYEMLSTPNYLRGVWEMVTGQPFDPVRARQVADMRVERDMSSVARKVA